MSQKHNKKTGKIKTSLRDVNVSNNNSDPIPILLIFCLSEFLIFVFVIILWLLSGGLRDRNIPETETFARADLDFVGKIGAFASEDNSAIAMIAGDAFSFPSQQDFVLNIEAFLGSSSHDLTEFVTIQNSLPIESRNNALIEYSMVDSEEGLTLKSSDSMRFSHRPTRLQTSTPASVHLQDFFLLDRNLAKDSLSDKKELLLTLENLSKNPSFKFLTKKSSIKPQLSLDTDEFSAKIAIADRLQQTLAPIPKSSSQPVPEPPNGFSAIILFLLVILLVSRQTQ